MRLKVDVVARFTHIWKTGVVVTALLATVVACGSSDSSRERNVALVAGTTCAKPGQVSKISKVSVVCAKTITGNIWYPTMKSKGRAVSCAKSGAVRKKKAVVWVCGVTKGKKLWSATSPLPAAVLQAAVVVEPGVSQPVTILESTDVATPSQPVVADNNVLANPAIPDEPPVTTPSTVPGPKTAPASYSVGDTGPGGGKVFYVADSEFTSTGSACGTACKYLEAAPTGWITTATPAGQTNCTVAGSGSLDPKCGWSANTSDSVGTTGTAIGAGYANTSAMITQSSSAGKAATVARAFQGGGKTDWFLPSKDELNQMFVNKTAIGGLAASVYWTSSENGAGKAWLQFVDSGSQYGDGNKPNTYYVRPVRAFSIATAPMTTTTVAQTTTTTTTIPKTTTTVPKTTTTVAQTTTTTTVPNSYKVGDKGPSGGIIIYVDLARPVGSRFFEAACAGWSDGTCGGSDLIDPKATWGCAASMLAGADGQGIGAGKQNTIGIVAGCADPGIAARLADVLVLGGQSDWFLPSREELNEVYKLNASIGGFSSDFYWSSFQYRPDVGFAWGRFFSAAPRLSDWKKNLNYVRPVRSF